MPVAAALLEIRTAKVRCRLAVGAPGLRAQDRRPSIILVGIGALSYAV